MIAANVAAQESYVIDIVCRGAERTYRIDGEPGSTWIWKIEAADGTVIDLTNAKIRDFEDFDINGDPSSSSEITITWDVTHGTYNLSVEQTSTHGCVDHELGEIEVVPAVEVPVLAATQPTCEIQTGTIEVTSPLGAGLTYSIDGTTFQTGTTFANLVPGVYTVTVKNTDGCTNTADETIDPAPVVPEVSVLAATQPDCDIPTGTIEVTSPLGTGLTYSIDGTSFQTGTTFANLVPG
ncbi:MAG: Calx-beta domain-containing protein, partial [Bacteroidetes bacterium]